MKEIREIAKETEIGIGWTEKGKGKGREGMTGIVITVEEGLIFAILVTGV
jgi:hypothetical protein